MSNSIVIEPINNSIEFEPLNNRVEVSLVPVESIFQFITPVQIVIEKKEVD